MLNVIAIMGRLVRDPELRQTTTGKTVASFRIACDRGRRDANGQTQADFFDVTAWDKIAEFVAKYFAKGSLIAIDGRLQSRNYQDKNGNNRTAIEILVNNVHFAGAKNQATQPTPTREPDVAPAPASATSLDSFAPIDDTGDLPF